MKCPGQDTQYWKPGAIFDVQCPECGRSVEFFKDDTTRKCDHCGHRFVNPRMDFGCAAYCPYAEQCLGTLPAELADRREDLLKDRVAVEVKRYLKNDFRRIGRASRRALYAQRIGVGERCNLGVALPAAYLYRIGGPEAERKHGRATDAHLETEGPPAAAALLKKLGARRELVDAVCGIVGRHRPPEAGDSIEFKVVYDADQLVRLEDRSKEAAIAPDAVAEAVAAALVTRSGRGEAGRIFSGA